MSDSTPTADLTTPLTIGSTTLRNRLVATAHGLAAVDDGIPNDDDAAYWSRISRGGAAMIITGGIQVSDATTLRLRNLGEAWHPWSARGFRKRADAIAAGGAVPVAQLGHLGRETLGAPTFFPFEAPSAIRGPREPVAARVLDHDGIRSVVESFGVSAANMIDAGYRGIEIHAAHGYLLAQFLSKLVNDRGDRYGGNAAGRSTLLIETIERIRAYVPDALLGVRFSVENDPGGLTAEDLTEIAAILADRAPVDYVNISFGNRGYYVRDMATTQPPLAHAAAQLAGAIPAPLLISSAFRSRSQINKALADGAAMVGMARPFIADPDVAAKLLSDREHEIRPCVSCNEECRAFEPSAMCTVNPRLGPHAAAAKPATTVFLGPLPRTPLGRVAIVGAGPAGLECALTLGAAGHTDITVFDEAADLGGQLLPASRATRRSTWGSLIDFYRSQLQAQGIPTRLGAPVTEPADLDGYDAVVWALGAAEAPPEIAGLATEIPLLRSTDYLLGDAWALRPIVVDDGFGWWPTVSAVETAIECGANSVTVVTAGAGFASSIPGESRLQRMEMLRGAPLRVIPHARLTAGVSGGLSAALNGSDLREQLHADLIIVVGERVARPTPFRFDGLAVSIGDGVMPRRVSHAIAEGHAAAGRLLGRKVVAVTARPN